MDTVQSNTLVLEAEGLAKTFARPVEVEVLVDVTLKVAAGESVAIMGASGEGKSTLLHIIGTLERPCKGILRIAGCDVEKRGKAKVRNRHIGFIFQTYNLLEDYTALENVLMPLRIARCGIGGKGKEKALSLLEKVGLADRAHFDAKLLSGGEKQRVAIARALCNDPSLILADEPSGNLDHHTSQHIHEILLASAKEEGKALVVATHDKELASLCDRQFLLQDGLLRLTP